METHFKSVHEGKKQYMCSNCGSKFATKRYMLSHISHVHDKNKKSKRICSFCGKSYSNINFNRHIASVHEQKKLHMCSDCGRRFYGKRDLQRHILVHEKRK